MAWPELANSTPRKRANSPDSVRSRKVVNDRPRLILAGLSGGAGKTILSLGLCRALKRKGRIVRPFKKGPDYIDAAWLGLAAGAKASNLDPFLMEPAKIPLLFRNKARDCDIAIIEGNRGLFDGKDVSGTCSTSELARILKAPVILIIDCTKMTRTAAAIVAGCKDFEPDLNLAGVILNRVAGDRHRKILQSSIERYTGIPVLGALPKLPKDPIPERHMGLISDQEHEGREEMLETLADIVDEHVDLDGVWGVAEESAKVLILEAGTDSPLWPVRPQGETETGRVRLGFIRDAAFWFYYEENLEALVQAGAELVELSLIDKTDWPDIQGLYIGGGFPETMAPKLSENVAARQRVRAMSEMGLPIFAECGGFMYLGQSLSYQGQKFPMAGVFPVRTELSPKPQGLGYVKAEVVRDNPYFSKGDRIYGHEFHYSRCIPADGSVLTLSLKLDRGEGMLAGYDGLLHKNTYAAYTHIHALGTPEWAPRFVAAARRRLDLRA